VQDLIGKDGLGILKLYLAPVRTFWKGIPQDSQVRWTRCALAEQQKLFYSSEAHVIYMDNIGDNVLLYFLTKKIRAYLQCYIY